MLKQTQYLANLTPLRGIAAILVVAFHFDSVICNLIPHVESQFFSKSYLMVDLFFIMSGFIMYHVYSPEFNLQVKWPDYKNFLIARFARIYPMHLVTLLVLMLIYFSLPIPKIPIYEPSAIITNILLIHSMGIHSTFTWNIPSWSISAEWWAYVAFPLFVPLIQRKKTIASIIIVLLIISAYYVVVFQLSKNTSLDVTYNYGYLRGIGGFFSGMILYEAYANKLFQKILGSDTAFCVVTIYLLMSLHLGVNDLLVLPGFAVLLICTVYNYNNISRLFQSKKMQFFGNISYSIYLLQGILTFVVFIGVSIAGVKSDRHSALLHLPTSQAFASLVVYLVILILVSSVTYAKIEKPARRWINNKFGKERHVLTVPR